MIAPMPSAIFSIGEIWRGRTRNICTAVLTITTLPPLLYLSCALRSPIHARSQTSLEHSHQSNTLVKQDEGNNIDNEGRKRPKGSSKTPPERQTNNDTSKGK